MKIPNPKAKFGQKVKAMNYRSRPATWEIGKVVELEYSNRWGAGFSWSYRVIFDRQSRTGRPIHVYLGENGIEKLK